MGEMIRIPTADGDVAAYLARARRANARIFAFLHTHLDPAP